MDVVRAMLEEIRRCGWRVPTDDQEWIRGTNENFHTGNVLTTADEERIERIWKQVRKEKP